MRSTLVPPLYPLQIVEWKGVFTLQDAAGHLVAHVNFDDMPDSAHELLKKEPARELAERFARTANDRPADTDILQRIRAARETGRTELHDLQDCAEEADELLAEAEAQIEHLREAVNRNERN